MPMQCCGGHRRWGKFAVSAAGVAWLLAGAAAPGGTIRADVPDSAYRDLAAQSSYATVGSLRWTENGASMIASGTLINDQWVLTAAHVTQEINSSNIGGLTFNVGGTSYHAAETLYNNAWDGDVNNGHDLGLVKLDAPITDLEPARLYLGRGENLQIGTVVGFGVSGTGLTGAVSAAGTKRAGTNVLGLGSALNNIPWSGGGDDTMLVADFDAPVAGATGDPTLDLSLPTSLEFCAAPGDSGGGWFVQSGGQNYLAGVTSFLLSNPQNGGQAMYGDIFGASRVSSYLDWIWDNAVRGGDLNSDGAVNSLDIAPFVQRLTAAAYDIEGDLNRDGLLNSLDISKFVQAIAGTAGAVATAMAVPEPMAAVVIAAGALMLIRRRPAERC